MAPASMGRVTKALTHEDKFARDCWRKGASRRYIKHAKRANRRKLRQLLRDRLSFDISEGGRR